MTSAKLTSSPSCAGLLRFNLCRVLAYSTAAAALALTSGCSTVDIHQQALLSKPNMQFSDSPSFSYSSVILPQLETGSAVTGGAQATTCSACK